MCLVKQRDSTQNYAAKNKFITCINEKEIPETFTLTVGFVAEYCFVLGFFFFKPEFVDL